MSLSEVQKDTLIKYYGNSLARAIQQVLEEEQVHTLYGDREQQVSLGEINLQVKLINELIEKEIRSALGSLSTDVLKIEKQAKEFENRIHSLENVIEPDKTDVHNINRRIELLAQRIAKLENKKRWL